MARALYLQTEARWPVRLLRLAAFGLGLAATALELAAQRMALRVAEPAQEREREFGVIEIDGLRYGAVYERGELVAVLDEVRI